MLNRFIKLFVVVGFLVFGSISGDENTVGCHPQVIAQFMNEEHVGVLKFKDNGYLYLDVSDEFISKVLPYIETSGKLTPTRHYTEENGIGAHISVIYEKEKLTFDDCEILEIGQPYMFTIRELSSLKLNCDSQKTRLWMIDVDAPELSHIREKYGLTPLFKEHNFHITLGTESL